MLNQIRYPCQKYSACAGFIEQMSELPEDRRLNFTFQDFFEPNEIDHFLQNFTVPANQYNQTEAKTPVGLKSCLTWPRRFVDTVNLNSVRRWNQVLKRNYLQKGWNGLLHFYMFSDRPEGTNLAPLNFAELMSSVETWDDSSVSEDSWEPPSKSNLFEGQEVVSDGERPFSDGDIESDLDYYPDEPGWNDPSWRRMLESRILQKRAELVRWNELIESDVNRKHLRKREPDPYWNYMLDEIDRMDNLDKIKMAKTEIDNKDDGLYVKEDEVIVTEEGTMQNEVTQEEAETSIDVLNQGFAEADSNENNVTTDVATDVAVETGEDSADITVGTEEEVSDQILWVEGSDLDGALTGDKQNSADDRLSSGSSQTSKPGQSQAKLHISNEMSSLDISPQNKII